MKTLNILFESPNVFKVLPEWPEQANFDIDCNLTQQDQCEKKSEFRGVIWMCRCAAKEFDFNFACEQSKANAIRIENAQILQPFFDELSKTKVLKHGDIFQVEGFEYKIQETCCDGHSIFDFCEKDCEAFISYQLLRGLPHANKKVAILKLAKEEEPKEQDKLFGACYEFEQIGYNKAIEDCLKVIHKYEIVSGNPVFNDIYKLKK